MKGWILDLYPGAPGEMVVWLKGEDGEAVRLVDHWSPSMYVAADDRANLKAPLEILSDDIAWWRTVARRERVTDRADSEVVEVKLKDARALQRVAERIERMGPFGTYRLYNVDVPPNQSYLYEHDLFPLACCEVSKTGDRLGWSLLDDVWACDYRIPNLRKVKVDVSVEKQGRLPNFQDRLKEIRLESDNGAITIGEGDETHRILELVRLVKEADPDFVLTSDGDTFLLPYLVKRAEANSLSGAFSLDRDGTALRLPTKKGTSYFSYGRIHFKPSAMKLYGRVHIDVNTSFAFSEVGFEGLFELSRVCRMPLHTATRATIGKALSSLQAYNASKMGLLVPWKPTLAESFKSRSELLVADRGGFIFEPKMGMHEGVGELDFDALFPNIMLKKNISAETVRCSCCPDSKNRVPELDWNVCERRTGIIPEAMTIVVGKRLQYKQLKRNSTGIEREIYDRRQAVLKWIGVVCLSGESYVFVKNEEGERCVQIGAFIDELVGNRVGEIECPAEVFVAGIGEDMKAKYCKVDRLIKQKNEQKMLRIRMEDGREVEVTPDHPFFTFKDSTLAIKAASELRLGELVPVAKRIPSPPSDRRTIDLIERLNGILSHEERLLWRVAGEPIKAAIQKNRTSLISAALAEGYSVQMVRLWAKSGIIPFGFLALLGVEPSKHQELRIGTGRRAGGRIAWIPATLRVDESLGFFLGLYVADGTAGRNSVRIDIGESEPDLVETTRRVVADLFGSPQRTYKEKNARMFVLQIHSATLVQVLERIFDLPGSAARGKLKVPRTIFSAPEDAVQGFLEGMIAGDGHASKQRNFIDIATKSKDLLCQLTFLAARAKLTFRTKKMRIHSFPLYTIEFTGPETLTRISNWRYLKDAHRATASLWANQCGPSCSHSYYDRLPADESGFFTLAKKTRTSSEPHVRVGSSMCPKSVRKKIERIRTRHLGELQLALIEKLEEWLAADIGFVRILSITELDSRPEYVYCFRLDPMEHPGFFAGKGLVYVHNCFGYLGHSNAKFGRIDAHISVCAWDRKILVDAARVAERRGFEVIHGIVDSLWLKKEGAEERDYLEVKEEIRAETGFEISFEGIYKWIAFLPSKMNPRLPVLNRYFGAYRSGDVKVRGIEARRHDTPRLFKRCQMEVLEVLAKADTLAEARLRIPECVAVFQRYVGAIRRRDVPAEELAFSRDLSKAPGDYTNRTLQASVARQLAAEGVDLHAGEGIRYIIAERERGVPLDFGEGRYSPERYVELLSEACATVLQEFDGSYEKRRLMGLARGSM
jgi:DNA polymerase elongation subunit (family B)